MPTINLEKETKSPHDGALANSGHTVLITGGAGYIGSHAVKLFLERGHRVVVFDNLCRGYKEPIDILAGYGNLEFVQGDLRNTKDLHSLFSRYSIDTVLHFAALCLVDESMSNPFLYFENNVCGSLNLFRAMDDFNVKRIIFSSTCAVYGDVQTVPVEETHPVVPANPYGESKLAVETMLGWFGRLRGLRYVILRYFNVCGSDENGIIGDSKRPSQLLMQNCVRGAMKIEPFYYTCPAVNTPDGTPIRDYINVEDLVRAHYSAWQYVVAGGLSDVFNLGSGVGYSVKEIVSEVERLFGTEMAKQKGTERKGEYAKIFAHTAKAAKALGWKPEKTLDDSVTSLRKWYSRYPNGYNY